MKRTPAFLAACTAAVLWYGTHGADAGELIAHVTPSTGKGAVVVSAPDGSNARTLFEPPAETTTTTPIGTLAWAPDGKHLAFSSNHEWARSLNLSDIYVISRDGSDLKRPTAVPSPGKYEGFPKGRVTVIVDNPSVHSSETVVFVDGAREPVSFLGRQGRRNTITFEDVADFGKGVRQYVRVFRAPAGAFGACWLDLGVFADVEPGKTVDAGKLTYSNQASCMRAWHPFWIDSDTVGFLYVEYPQHSFPPNNVWSVPLGIKPGEPGKRLLNMGSKATTRKLTFASAGPKTATGQEMIFLVPPAIGRGVYVAPASDATRLSRVDFGLCPKTVCKVTGIDWRSDGNGLFIAEARSGATGPQPRNVSVLFEFDATTRSNREILALPNEVIGRIAVSPDNKTIAFERTGQLIDDVSNVRFGNRAHCPCSIWLVDVDGGNLRQFAADGRAPAWSR